MTKEFKLPDESIQMNDMVIKIEEPEPPNAKLIIEHMKKISKEEHEYLIVFLIYSVHAHQKVQQFIEFLIKPETRAKRSIEETLVTTLKKYNKLVDSNNVMFEEFGLPKECYYSKYTMKINGKNILSIL